MKFGKLHDYAKSIDAEYVASGHHAQIKQGDDGAELHMGADAGKDQVAQEMTACMESAADGAARTACKDTTAKAALATSLGKQT